MKRLAVCFFVFVLSLLTWSSVCAESRMSPAYSVDVLYTDTDTNATFLVPDGWRIEPLNEERESIDVKFVPNDLNEFMHVIMYGSYDIFSKELEEAGYAREDMNNSMISKEMLSAIFQVDASSINIVNYGNYNYCKQNKSGQYESGGLSASIQMTIMATIENGYVFLFQFYGSNDGKSFEDFEYLLRSASYPSK